MSKVIALGAGHGLHTKGKQCLDGTKEWFLNDRIMDLVEKELRENYDCTVLRVDDTTGKKDISLSARVKAVNNANADYYISMHHNAGLNGRGEVGGTMVFYAASNVGRVMQATALYNAIQSRTNLPVHPKRNKIEFRKFYVIYNTKCPALLVENGFMDSTVDLPYILSDRHAQETAKGVVAFLVEQLSLEPKKAVDLPAQIIKDVLSAYYPAYTGPKTTLYNAMTSMGLDGSYGFRKKIAKANGITGYVGTATQNTRMYNMLVAGILKKA